MIIFLFLLYRGGAVFAFRGFLSSELVFGRESLFSPRVGFLINKYITRTF